MVRADRLRDASALNPNPVGGSHSIIMKRLIQKYILLDIIIDGPCRWTNPVRGKLCNHRGHVSEYRIRQILYREKCLSGGYYLFAIDGILDHIICLAEITF